MGFRVLAAGLVASIGLQAGAGGEEIAPHGVLRKAGLAQYWRTEMPFDRGDSAVSAYLLEDSLYVVTRMGDLHAVDPNVGLVRWVHRVAGRGKRVFKPSHLFTVDGRAAVLVAHSEGAYVYDRGSGAVLAEIPEMWPAGSGAVGDSSSLYAGSSDGFIYAVQWYNPTHDKPLRTWKVLGGGPVTSMPVLINNVLYFASQSGSVFAFTADWNKNLHWKYSTEAAIVADLYVDESGVYVAGLDRSLYRLDVSSGAVLWRYRFPQPLREAPIVSQRTVYQHCRGTGLYAIDVDTSELLWTQSAATALVSRRADRTCVRMGDEHVALLDSTGGQVRHVIPIAVKSVVAANPDGLPFYVVTPDGDVACFAADDVRHLRADDILKGLTPPGRAEPPGTDEGEAGPAEGREGAADLDDPLRSGTDR